MNFAAIAIFLTVRAAFAIDGVTVDEPASKDNFTCMKNAGITFVPIRAWQNISIPDPNGVQTYKNAVTAGIFYPRLYMDPCYSCGDPESVILMSIQNEYFINTAKLLKATS